MIDIKKQISYWRDGAKEDWPVARSLVQQGHTRHGLFFAHLAIEKAIKAHVCRSTSDLAPKQHSLLRLAEKTDLTFPEKSLLLLSRFDRYQIEGRYPESLPIALTVEEAQEEMDSVEEIFQWLISQLPQ